MAWWSLALVRDKQIRWRSMYVAKGTRSAARSPQWQLMGRQCGPRTLTPPNPEIRRAWPTWTPSFASPSPAAGASHAALFARRSPLTREKEKQTNTRAGRMKNLSSISPSAYRLPGETTRIFVHRQPRMNSSRAMFRTTASSQSVCYLSP